MNAFSAEDELYMQRCLQLAACGAGSTSPNPMVGAVIVCDGRIIGEGYHIRAGEPHAEVNAVNSVKAKDIPLLSRSTIYVSLEPCSHYGKTPPCCDLIISRGIPRVVIATTDFNAQVNGGGIARMRDAGIEVVVGVLESESRRLNRAFFTYHICKRPAVTLKWAQSADGFIDRLRDGGTPVRFSNSVSQVAVHKLRAMHDAIIVGTRTAMLDNPSLDIRHWAGRAPLRLVIDRKGKLPVSLKLFDGLQSALRMLTWFCVMVKKLNRFCLTSHLISFFRFSIISINVVSEAFLSRVGHLCWIHLSLPEHGMLPGWRPIIQSPSVVV